jgi:type I restriction enzyme, S subunit
LASRRPQGSWRETPIGDVVQRISDRRSDPVADGFERFVGVEHLDTDELELRRWGSASDEGIPPTFRYVFPAGAVLFPTRRPALRKCALASFSGITGEKVLALVPKDSRTLLPSFLPFLLGSSTVRQWVTDRAIGSVTPHFRWRDLAQMTIALPPIDQQEEMAALLACAQTLVQRLRTSAELAFEVQRAAQSDLLLDNGSAAGSCAFEELAYLNPTDPPLSPTDPFVPMEGVKEWTRAIEEFEQRGTRGGVRAQKGDVLMARISPCLQNGKIAQVPATVSRCGGSTEFIVVRARPGVDQSYIYWLLTSDKFRGAAIRRMSGTTGRQRVSALDLLHIMVPSTTQEQQRAFGAHLDQIYQERAVLGERLREATRVFAGLMDRVLRPVFI